MDSITQKPNTWTRHILILVLYGITIPYVITLKHINWYLTHVELCYSNQLQTKLIIGHVFQSRLFYIILISITDIVCCASIGRPLPTTIMTNVFDILLNLQWYQYVRMISIQTWAIMLFGDNSSGCFQNIIAQRASVIHHAHCPLSNELRGCVRIYTNGSNMFSPHVTTTCPCNHYTYPTAIMILSVNVIYFDARFT